MATVFYSGIMVSEESTKLLNSFGSNRLNHHTTIVYSEKMPSGKIHGLMHRVVAKIVDIRHWEGADGRGYTVAVLDCELFRDWNYYFLGKGCVNDFEYIPHITLDKGKGDTALQYQGLIGQTIGFDDQYIQIMNIG